ncbi:MAG TPA: DUF1080 domain-containing protein [Puia sp.]|nr:DUF1080 domain-containing protein [Puia sp.]
MSKLLTIRLACVFAILLNSVYAQTQNTLSAQEKKDGWQLLFDGKDLKGWHSFQQKSPGKCWQVQNGSIALVKNSKSKYEDYKDLLTDKEYDNFDFKVEWMVEPGGNSGLMFYVSEQPQFHDTYESGPEMQITDLYLGGDSRINKCRAGDIYDLIAADTEWVTVGGKWNLYEIKAQNGHIQLFQNNHKIIDTYFWTDEWNKLIAASKFTQWPGFGTFKKGHISFQGTENGKLLFRNIKIKEL